MSYVKDLDQKNTPVSSPIRGRNMQKGRGGGYGFQISDWDRLDRFLILGHEGGTYYAGQRELTFETVDCIDRCLQVDAARTVNRIADISLSGRAPKNDPAIFALAYVAAKKGTPAAKLALDAIPKVCRIGTHLFDFLTNLKSLDRGWGRAVVKGVADWYLSKDADKLAYQVTKYAQRNGWSHRDVLRKCHAYSDNLDVNNVLQYVAQHDKWLGANYSGDVTGNYDHDNYLAAVDEAKNPKTSAKRLVNLIYDYRLVREHISTEALNLSDVWRALLCNMPLTAMIRNLAKMTKLGVIGNLSEETKKVCQSLRDVESLKRQRVHPLTVLLAIKTYGEGKGQRGSLTWVPDSMVMKALDDAFYLAFDAVEPTGKNFMLGVDVSGSMSWGKCVGTDILMPSEAAAVMAMLAVRTEENTILKAFAGQLRDLNIHHNDSLPTVLQKTRSMTISSTQVAAPIEFALRNKVPVDVFCIYTDNETNCGRHPHQALKDFREKVNPQAKLAVFGLAQTDFTVADPDDAGQMDFVGFDAAAPTLLADFARH